MVLGEKGRYSRNGRAGMSPLLSFVTLSGNSKDISETNNGTSSIEVVGCEGGHQEPSIDPHGRILKSQRLAGKELTRLPSELCKLSAQSFSNPGVNLELH